MYKLIDENRTQWLVDVFTPELKALFSLTRQAEETLSNGSQSPKPSSGLVLPPADVPIKTLSAVKNNEMTEQKRHQVNASVTIATATR